MSTQVSFGNRTIIEPGVYSQIKAGVNNVPQDASTGNVLIIDTGNFSGGYIGGSGINGELANNLSSIYEFSSLKDFRSFIRGGEFWDAAEYIFNPVFGALGAPKVIFVSASTTTAAFKTWSFTNGTVKVLTRNEGTGANGVISNSDVRVGYGFLFKTGVIDVNKWFVEFYEGTFTGLDSDGEPFDGIAQDDATPITIAKSPEFDNLNDLVDWMRNDFSFNQRFKLDETVTNITGTGAFLLADYTANNTLDVFAGGTLTYNASDLDDVLEAIVELDATFILCDRFGDNAQGAENTKILAHIFQDAEFKKFMIIGGGDDETKFNQSLGSIEIAQYFDSSYAIVVHSGFEVDKPFSSVKINKSSFYHAACIAGRLGGLQPQKPITFEKIRITNFNHELTRQQREVALQAGVLHNRFVPLKGYVINQGINSIQRNTQLINSDGTSHEISIMRIAEQLNKELVLNLRTLFIGQNLNTASPEDVKAFVEGYLLSKTATKTIDNLIIRFEKVTVTQTQDYYDVNYCFVPNGPLNKIFVTGFILDANLSA